MSSQEEGHRTKTSVTSHMLPPSCVLRKQLGPIEDTQRVVSSSWAQQWAQQLTCTHEKQPSCELCHGADANSLYFFSKQNKLQR